MKTKNLLIVVLIMLAFSSTISNFSVAQGKWTKKTDFAGDWKDYKVSFSIGNKGYVGIQSQTDSPEKKDFWEWDQITDTWTRKADFPGDFYYITACFSIGTKGYVITDDSVLTMGDFEPIISTNQLWEFDPEINTWSKKATLPSKGAIVFAAGFSIGTKGYIGTGSEESDLFMYPYTLDFWEWDQETDTWTRKSDFKGTIRAGAVGFSIGNKGYIGTGSNRYTYNTNDFWEWDQETDVWTRKADFGGMARAEAIGFSIGNKGYIGTGYNSDSNGGNPTYLNDFWEWDQATNIWKRISDFGGMGRTGAIGFVIGNKGYIGLGNNYSGSNNNLSDFWVFGPNGEFEAHDDINTGG